MSSSYKAASQTDKDFRRWVTYPRSANSDYNYSVQQTLVSRCRDAHRNQPLARAAVERLKHNVTGMGLRLQSHLDAELLGISPDQAAALERKIELEFSRWSYKCDWEGVLDFEGIQTLAYTTMLLSGDAFVNTFFRPGSGMCLQVVEPDQVSNPNWTYDTRDLINGVELQEGRPIAYWIMTQHPGDDLVSEFHWDRYRIYGEHTGMRRVMHIYDKDRPGQVRGVPYLAPILGPLKQLDRYTDAEISAAVASSLIACFVKTETGAGFPTYTASTAEPIKSDEFALSSGAVINLMPSETIESFNPSRPNTSYEPFVMGVFKQIGAALGMPMELLMLHFQSSYSAARAAIMQAWKLVEYHRKIVVRSLCDPVYDSFLWYAVATGTLELPGFFDSEAMRYLYSQASWIGPTRASIDEGAEIRAATDRVSLGISNRQTEAEQMLGYDWASVNRQLIREKKLRQEGGLEDVASPAAAATE